MNIYIAGPIDNSKDLSWVDSIILHLTRMFGNMGVKEPLLIFSPQKAFAVGGELGHKESLYVAALNTKALDLADIVLVYYQPEVSSWGTPIELANTYHNNQKVFLWEEFRPKNSPCRSLDGFPVYVQAHVPDNLIHNGAANVVKAVIRYLGGIK